MFPPKASSSSPVAQQQPVALSALRVQTSVAGLIITKMYGTNRKAGNLIWKDGFQAIQHDTVTPGGGGGKGDNRRGQDTVTTTYTYQTALIIALGAGTVASIGKVWQDKSIESMAHLGLSLFNGTSTQVPWGYLTTNFPANALFNRNLAFVAGPTYQLNSSASMQNNSLEVQMTSAFNPGAGIVDANPRDIVLDWLTNTQDGAGFPFLHVGDLSAYSNYCVALGLFMSPFIDAQVEARQFLEDTAQLTNSAWVWSGSTLRIIPYGDTAVSGNGVTYAPDMTPLFDLTDDDFKRDTGADPIITTRINPADAPNIITVEIVDRSQDYNTSSVEAKDQGAIEAYGLNQFASISAHGITSPAVGQIVAQAILQRQQYVRNTHAFTIGWKFGILDPMDLVTITDGDSGLYRQLVRILTIDEDNDGFLAITAEQVDIGVAHSPVYGQQAPSGLLPDNNAKAPSANPPMIFGGPLQLLTGLEMWMAACGPDGYGGCDVWVSSTGQSFKNIGRMFGSSRMGVLTAPFPAGNDPDTVDACAVDLSESRGVLLSGEVLDADLANTLCYIQDVPGRGEFFSYSNATLTGVSKYRLDTYLRRGLYSVTVPPHATGAQFTRIDKSIFRIPYTADQIGDFVYVKLTAFNVHGAGEQTLDEVLATQILVPSPPIPPDVEDFSAIQAGEVVAFTWKRINDNILIGYDIRFGPAGVTDWNAMLPLTEAASGAYEANASVPSGNWTFAIRARDIAQQLSANPAYSTRLVVDAYPTVSSVQQDPTWPGTKVGCRVHYSGVLIPDSQTLAQDDLAQDIFDHFVLNPVAQFSYEAAGVGLSKLALVRVSAAFTGRLGPGETEGKPNPLLFARYSQDVGNITLMWNVTDTTLMWDGDPTTFMWAGITDYELWTKGVVRTTYVQEKVVVNTADGVMMLQSFLAKVDQPIITDGGLAVSVAPGGTRINFNTPDYLFDPFVSATSQGSGLFATASAVDPDGFTCHIFNVNAGGTDVGGTVNWSCHN
jgi:hypothetical protein